MKKAEFVEKDDDIFAALYPVRKTAKAHGVSAHEDGSEIMWLSQKWCKEVRKAKDGQRTIFQIPKHQARHHFQLTRDDGV